MGKAAEAHSRHNPSARYRRLLELYREMHVRGELTRGIAPSGLFPAYWGVERIVCFDPAYEPFSRPPQGRFDGVICTDVLEHCPETDLAWIIAELFGFARRFVFASIACHPAVKRLPNGENAHCTVTPPQFWDELFISAANGCPGVLWEARAYTEGSAGGDVRLGNAAGAELSPVAIA